MVRRGLYGRSKRAPPDHAPGARGGEEGLDIAYIGDPGSPHPTHLDGGFFVISWPAEISTGRQGGPQQEGMPGPRERGSG